MVFLWFPSIFFMVHLVPRAANLPGPQPGAFAAFGGRGGQLRQARHQDVTTGAVPSSTRIYSHGQQHQLYLASRVVVVHN